MAIQSSRFYNFAAGASFGVMITFCILSVFESDSILSSTIYSQLLRKDKRDSRISSSYDANIENRILFPNEKNKSLDLSGKDKSVTSHEELDRLGGRKTELRFQDEGQHHDEGELAEMLFKKVRVLCWVMTSPSNLDKKAIHIRATWARRCNKLIFISSVTNTSFPTIGLNVSEGRDHLTAKTMKAFDYVADNYMDECDWFMKADDDTYVILENLRYFLSPVDTNKPIFYGHHFKVIVKQGYFSGGGGYVLSKEALRRLRGRLPDQCRTDGGAEDVELGACMEKLGVETGYSLDALGRSRFHCFHPEAHINGGYPGWYYQYDAYGAEKGISTVSDYSISFHYISPNNLYALEFFVYHLRPYGLFSKPQELNVNANTTRKEIKWKEKK